MLILASQSASRKAMLEAAGVAFTCCPAAIDERAVESLLENEAPGETALALAEAKALAVSAGQGGALVLGSDSLVTVEGRRFDKPRSRDEAAAHLRQFSGREMHLYSAAALARSGGKLWGHADRAVLHVRVLSESFITSYLDEEWPVVAGCVGVFRIEASGAQLFSAIEGSHFTVLGMPLLAVLGALREYGELQA
jgi:septum formation protein